MSCLHVQQKPVACREQHGSLRAAGPPTAEVTVRPPLATEHPAARQLGHVVLLDVGEQLTRGGEPPAAGGPLALMLKLACLHTGNEKRCVWS